MENTKSNPSSKEFIPMAHKLETPVRFRTSLRDLADKIVNPEEEKNLQDNLVHFKQTLFDFMERFNISKYQVKTFRDDKKQTKGGFSKKAVQKHAFKGEQGLRLVRDNLSNGAFLKSEEVDLYSALLNRKLVEETKELTEAMSDRERVEEMSDVMEVFDTMLKVKKIDGRIIEQKRQLFDDKRTRRRLSRRKVI